MIDRLLDYVAPHHCSGCGIIGTLLCDNCKYDIISEPHSACLVCRKPSRVGICKVHNLSYEKAWCVGQRKDTLQRLIGSYKFRNTKAASRILASLLDAHLPQLPDTTIIVPIPTVASHIRERGYDHILLIARRLATLRSLPIRSVIIRKNTKTQHHANRHDRMIQALSAFSIHGSVDPSATYLIIDDIVTTGATIEYAALLLKEAGAKTIWVAAIARQPLD